MRRPRTKRKCKHCQTFFDPDPRSAGRQRYCSQPECRKASKANSQRRWQHQPHNRDDFKDPTHVERVRQWRKDNPGYWRRQRSRAPEALQDALEPQEVQKQRLGESFGAEALQDAFFMQSTVFIGFIAHLSGLSFQDDIEATTRKLQQLGRDILSGATHQPGGMQDVQTPHLFGQPPQSPQTMQLGRSAPGP